MALGLTRIGLSTAPRTQYFRAAAATGTTVYLGTATEVDSAQSLVFPQYVSVGTAAEIDSAPSLCVDDSRLNFNDYTISGYAGSQDASGNTFSVSDCGHTLTLSGNNWKRILLSYTVTANTILELDFKSTAQSEIQGIGFDTDDSLSSNRTFQFWGSQTWGITTYMNYGSSSPDYKHYTIPVGTHYTGSFSRLFFTNDDDASPIGNSTFSNIKIYEASAGQTIGVGSPSESDSASAVVVVNPRSYQLGSATESETALALTVSIASPIYVLIGSATEADSAESLAVDNPRGYGLDTATETDSANAQVSLASIVSLGSATETDSAAAITVRLASIASLGSAQETDSAPSLLVVNPRTHELGSAAEVDAAESAVVDNPRRYMLGLAQEQATASAFASVLNPKSVDLGSASESDASASVDFHKFVEISLASEIGTANALSVQRTLSMGLATEVDGAFDLFLLTVDTTADCVHVDSSYIRSGSSVASIASGFATATIKSPSASVLWKC